jgi:YVTN family beta-propeller protein
VKVFRTDAFNQVASITVGAVPHGLWPSGDGTRMYVGLENADAVAVIDTATNKLLTEIASGQGAQGVAYVPNAVKEGTKGPNLEPLGVAGEKVSVWLVAADGRRATEVTLFNQGLVQVLQAAITGLTPGQPYVLALTTDPKKPSALDPIASFKANPAGAAIVNAVGPLRQRVSAEHKGERRYLVIATAGAPGKVVQVQAR